MIPPLLTEMTVSFPKPSAFLFATLAASALTAGILFYALVENRWRLIRPAFIFALLCLIFFQFPSAVISEAITDGLNNEWFFFLVIHATPMAIASWVLLTPMLDVPSGTVSSPTAIGAGTVAVFGLLAVALAAAYLNRVPFDCTALYAIIHEPRMTLLARELSIKFAGSIFATMSFGALANTAAPLLIGISMPFLIAATIKFRLIPALFALTLIVLAISLVLLSGSKGLLIPAGLFVLASGIAWHRGIVAKVVFPALSLAFLMGAMMAFELVKERSQAQHQSYPFGACVLAVDACSSIAPFIASLKQREGSLGLSFAEVDQLDSERQAVCSAAGLESPSAVTPSPVVSVVPIDVVDRAFKYARALAYRAFISPVQVASWYFLYVEEKGHPGWGAMPVGRRFGDQYTNMPSEIAKTYGRIYSQGDSTSTSSSPTTFYLAYPANIGVLGSLVAILLVTMLDALFVFFARLSRNEVLGIAAGFSLVISINLILSDFVTAIETHGGGLALVILFVFASIETIRQRTLKR